MSRPELVVPVADLERGPKQVEYTLSEPWLRRALEGTDATPLQPGVLTVALSKNGREVLVRGLLEAKLTMPCVVTLDPVPVDIHSEILLMLAPQAPGLAPATTPEGRHPTRKRAGRKAQEPEAGAAAPARPERAGRAEKAKSSAKADGRWDDTPILSEEEAGRDTFDGHEIILDGFVREFLVLDLPMFPRRWDLPTEPTPANPPPSAGSQLEGQAPIDPRLSPLAELKRQLEKKNKE